MPQQRALRGSAWFWLWLPLFIGTLALALRLVYEQTVLSWVNGPQMVGFSLAHGGIGLLMFAAAALMLVWSIAAAVWLLWKAFARTSSHAPPLGRLLVASALAIGLIAVPERVWRYAMIRTVGPGAHAGEWLTYAAALGDLPTVRVLIDRGTNVDARNSDGSTPLLGAAVEGQEEVASYLIAHGADVNARTNLGFSAIGSAAEMNHRPIAELLVRHGARYPCVGATRRLTEANTEAPGEEYHVFSATDSTSGRFASRTDSTLAAWAVEFGVHPAACSAS